MSENGVKHGWERKVRPYGYHAFSNRPPNKLNTKKQYIPDWDIVSKKSNRANPYQKLLKSTDFEKPIPVAINSFISDAY